ncbi:hypothetical protein [Bradyrhizobium sp. CCBAU 45389]|uniref:hypothetical protein n=1 Tax=Bradyrhizobium sp. CCBAU 45389 TaxID=858429 RepID=UPI0023060AD6|nr:hypothetical protein [Bradyrhizobium sp. CCBAU 45389]MDA9398453.1 hypothetical protein [Bradyrhizobium sp. CCBAU 45389]
MLMTTTSEAQGLVEQFDPAALAAAAAPEPEAPEIPVPTRRSSRKSILALSVCALAINGSAAIYTWPSDLPSLNVRKFAELFPRPESSAPKPDPVVAALRDIQSTQQQHTASLQESNNALQQNAALLQQDSMVLLSLRQSITDERVDVRKISSQLSTLIAKVDSLQSVMMSDVTSSIRRANARYGLSAAMRKRLARESKPLGPVSVGGAPLSVPAAPPAPES